MKYIIVVGDGMSDERLRGLGGRTPLEAAEHPNMDMMASSGVCGLLKTVPLELTPGTDVAILTVLGYDAKQIHSGRGPLEAAGAGVTLEEDDLAFRCNFVTVADGVLKDHSAGHISTEEAGELLNTVREKYGRQGEVEFHLGVGYRHLLILRGSKYSDRVACTPPHDTLNTPVKQILVKPTGEEGVETANWLNEMILSSQELLFSHPVNQRRLREGKNPASMVWPWGHGRRPKITPLAEIYGVKGAAISAVDIVRGIGVFTGMDIIRVPGATGFHDTNYEGKADYALESLNSHDLVLVHVEAPDEASHIGDHQLKVKTIEDLDRRLLGRLLQRLKGDYTIAVMSDHTTLTEGGLHVHDPVPFAVYSTGRKRGDRVERFDEYSVKKGSLGVMEGLEFLPLLLGIR